MATNRLVSLMTDMVQSLNLNLRDKVVLTEAASGAYAVTPVLAALAGAEVYALGRDSRYGTLDDARRQIEGLLDEAGSGRLTVISEATPGLLSGVDVITNSGHLRPISREMLTHVSNACVIPLMYEKWEYRKADLDLAFCLVKGIRVGGTNERHPEIGVFDYLGDMAFKMIFDAGLCLRNNTFVVVANNDFGPYVANRLSQVAGRVGVIGRSEDRSQYDSSVDWLSEFPDVAVPEEYRTASAILFTAYPFDVDWIGAEGTVISVNDLRRQFTSPLVLRFAGDVRVSDLKTHGIAYHPRVVASGHMGIIPSDIGPDPVVRLQAGGLKAAQLMMEGKTGYKGHELVQLF